MWLNSSVICHMDVVLGEGMDTRTAQPTNEWPPRGRNSRREAGGLPNTRTVSHPAAPMVSLFEYSHTLATLVDSLHAEDLRPDGNPELTGTRGIIFFSSCHRRGN
jgi:hypothetical protein